MQRRGNNGFGLCPFHGEKTASFSVAPEKGIYYCFGCHRGGGVIHFIMEIENLSYPDAVRFLAKRAGLELYRELVKTEEDVPLLQLLSSKGLESPFRRISRVAETLRQDLNL